MIGEGATDRNWIVGTGLIGHGYVPVGRRRGRAPTTGHAPEAGPVWRIRLNHRAANCNAPMRRSATPGEASAESPSVLRPIAGSSVMPASTSATWRTSTVLPSRESLPAMVSSGNPDRHEQDRSAGIRDNSSSSPRRWRWKSRLYLTAKVPPKPQQTSGFRHLDQFEPLDPREQLARLALNAELAQAGAQES